jgi:hypothetical protein
MGLQFPLHGPLVCSGLRQVTRFLTGNLVATILTAASGLLAWAFM